MKKKILIIDDVKTQQLSLKLMMEKAGFAVVTADNGLEGIKAAFQNMPDLILSDVMMPNLNGYHLCRLLKEDSRTKHIPIILLTVLNNKIDKFWGLRAGADAFFHKVDSQEVLMDKINELISLSTQSTDSENVNIAEFENFDYSSKVAEILDQSLIESTIMNEFRDLSEFVLDEKVLNSRLFSLVSSILDYNLAGIFFNDSDFKKERILFFSQSELTLSPEILDAAKKEINDVLIKKDFSYFRYGLEYRCYEDINPSSKEISSVDDFNSKLIIPLEYEGKIIGALALFHVLPNKYSSFKFLNIILNELKIIMRIKWLYSETKLLSITDPLTALYNRRHFQQVLEKEFSRSNRYGTPLSIAMIDIDNFKKLNDNYGHLFGDEILQVISKMFLDQLRKTDFIARYGGEEIVVVLPETTISQAIIPIERLRNKIENHTFLFNEMRINVTVSIGIAQNYYDLLTTDNFIQKADVALYISKQKGKNRIELANMPV